MAELAKHVADGDIFERAPVVPAFAADDDQPLENLPRQVGIMAHQVDRNVEPADALRDIDLQQAGRELDGCVHQSAV